VVIGIGTGTAVPAIADTTIQASLSVRRLSLFHSAFLTGTDIIIGDDTTGIGINSRHWS
jgi:hypothetical protein